MNSKNKSSFVKSFDKWDLFLKFQSLLSATISVFYTFIRRTITHNNFWLVFLNSVFCIIN